MYMQHVNDFAKYDRNGNPALQWVHLAEMAPCVRRYAISSSMLFSIASFANVGITLRAASLLISPSPALVGEISP